MKVTGEVKNIETREYVIDFYKRRFNPTATEDQLAAVEMFLDGIGEDDEHGLFEYCKIVDGIEIDWE